MPSEAGCGAYSGATPHLLYVDADLLVVDKPAGLLAVPGRGPEGADCLLARLLAGHPDTRVVHRLDMGTSGLIVFARNAAAQRTLSQAFAARAVQKRYAAVVDGRPGQGASALAASGSGTIDLPIGADWSRRPLRQVDLLHGKPSRTRWQVATVADAADAGTRATTRLDLWPVTGRTHQLRVHLLASGHPILGDALYAAEPVRSAAPRLLLHACLLALAHPRTGEALRFHSPAPF